MTTDELSVLLSRYPPTARPLGPLEPLGNGGGTSGARLWRYRSGRGLLVARAWPAEGLGPDRLRRVHGGLEETRALGFVAIPEPDEGGETVQHFAGRLWEVAPWMPGEVDPRRPPARRRLRAAFIGLATFHQVLALHESQGPSPGLAARLGELEGLIGGGFEMLRRAIDLAAGDPLCDAARRWLELAHRQVHGHLPPLRHAAALTYRLQPCLRDARPDHFLFEGERLTGLVDFGAMGVEVVAGDLARLLAEWVGPDRGARAEALEAYARIRPLDGPETASIDAFESSAALLGAAHWIRWHFLEGRVFEDPGAVANGLARGLERLISLSAGRAW